MVKTSPSSTGDVGSISGRRTKIPPTPGNYWTYELQSSCSKRREATSTRDPRTATRESPCTTTKTEDSRNVFFFFLIKRKKESYMCLQVWCLVLAVDSFLILEVLTGLLLSPFFPSPSLFQSLSLCVASYLSSKTYLLWLAISSTLEKDHSTSQEFCSPISFTGFCSLCDTPRNRPDRQSVCLQAQD